MNRQMKSKKHLIKALLARGYNHDVVAVAAKCALSYVRGIAGDSFSPYAHVDHVKMIHGPWTTDPQGNLSREIRGE